MKIYFIITTCIGNKYGVRHSEHRKQRYIDSISSTLKLIENKENIIPIIVENNGTRQTYLNDFNCANVVYTDNNKYNFREKAMNELLDIKHVINKYNINDDDFVIKLTGRYKVLTDSFVKLVEENAYKYDAFVKFFNVCTLEYMKNDCVLGFYAIKCKYLKDFNYDCIKSPEVEFATYVRKNIENIKEVEKLYLECCFADNLRLLYI